VGGFQYLAGTKLVSRLSPQNASGDIPQRIWFLIVPASVLPLTTNDEYRRLASPGQRIALKITGGDQPFCRASGKFLATKDNREIRLSSQPKHITNQGITQPRVRLLRKVHDYSHL